MKLGNLLRAATLICLYTAWAYMMWNNLLRDVGNATITDITPLILGTPVVIIVLLLMNSTITSILILRKYDKRVKLLIHKKECVEEMIKEMRNS